MKIVMESEYDSMYAGWYHIATFYNENGKKIDSDLGTFAEVANYVAGQLDRYKGKHIELNLDDLDGAGAQPYLIRSMVNNHNKLQSIKNIIKENPIRK